MCARVDQLGRIQGTTFRCDVAICTTLTVKLTNLIWFCLCNGILWNAVRTGFVHLGTSCPSTGSGLVSVDREGRVLRITPTTRHWETVLLEYVLLSPALVRASFCRSSLTSFISSRSLVSSSARPRSRETAKTHNHHILAIQLLLQGSDMVCHGVFLILSCCNWCSL